MMWLTTLALIVLIIYLVREQGSGGRAAPSQENRLSPLDILDRKYAAGELTTEEYRERKDKLLEDQL